MRGPEWERLGVLTAEAGLTAALVGAVVVVLARRPPPVSREEAAGWREGQARLRTSLGGLPPTADQRAGRRRRLPVPRSG